MIKARSVAGDPWIGSAFVEGVAPFVYPEELRTHAIDDVRRTKVRLEEYIRRRGKELTEVKRGRGGIRDVEFAVQLLQIVHGRRDPGLRQPEHAARAGRARRPRGTWPRPTPRRSRDAYRFLRRLEHRLQIVRDLQTHDLPADPRARTHARAFARPDGRARARRTSTSGRPGSSAACTSGSSTGRCSRPSRARRRPRPLTARPPRSCSPASGSPSPARSYEVLRRLVDPRHADGQGAGARVPADGAGARPGRRPRRGARAPRADRRGGRGAPRPGGRARGRPRRGAAGSRTWPRRARSRPTCSWRTPERLTALADGGVSVRRAGGLVARGGPVRRPRARDPGRRAPRSPTSPTACCTRPSTAAEPDLPFAVIGMGKLGARELNFASDLDVLFVYEGEGAGRPASRGRRRGAGDAARSATRAGSPTPTCGRRAATARSRARSPATSSTGSATRRLWEFQSLLRARARGRRRRSWAGGSC